jgi:tetratricopeptide (TPR) repeat protein
MSLLLKALKQADRGSHLSLEPMEQGKTTAPAPPASAKAAADLMFEKQAAAEKHRMLLLLGVLAAVVLGMGIYFYLAIFMPWVFLPKPIAPAAPPPAATQSVPTPPVEILPPLTQAAPQTAIAAPPAPIAPMPPKRQTPPSEPHTTASARAATLRAAPPDNDIQISGGNASPANAILAAYQSLQEGRLDEARRAYEKLRALEPRNPDVLLGLALIAQRQGRSDDAVQFYLKTLDADPKNTFAQASLTGMIARADPAAAETKFKALIAQQPAAFLSFGLGNVYASQGRWNEAQNAYFEAQRREPDSPDYAFNLAVSLEHINQTHAALDYYQRALKLAQAQGGGAAFDVAQVKARVQRLSHPKKTEATN